MAKKRMKRKVKNATKSTVNTVTDNISSEVRAAAYSVVTQSKIPVLLKVCRLCESKDGPFLNIFDADKLIAKKIDELMPFTVLENDDLPHKICFRCSAKLEELFEFIQRCIKTQENLCDALGKTGPHITKSKMAKKAWEEKLNKSNMSNDDICDALIKKAMEGIQGIPSKTTVSRENSPVQSKRVTRSKETQKLESEKKKELQADENDDGTHMQKMSLEKEDDDSKPLSKNPILEKMLTKKTDLIHNKKTVKLEASESNIINTRDSKSSELKTDNSINNLSFDYNEPAPVEATAKKSNIENEKEQEEKKAFDIMDYISIFKVNDVGILFQCKLCNRNFLKKEVVESHQCAKNGIPNVLPRSIPAPEIPKAPTVKYIKIDNDMKKSLAEKTKKLEKPDNEKNSKNIASESITIDEDSNEPPKVKTKPKAGPASKTGRSSLLPSDSLAQNQITEQSPNTNPPNSTILPSVQLPAMPNLNCRFKLVPGPNSIFTLVQDTSVPPQPVVNTEIRNEEPKKSGRKRKSNETNERKSVNNTELKLNETIGRKKSASPEVIDLEKADKPYPVGLFQTMPHEPPVSEASATFTTPAMKKQSYTIVQTGNPNKLLISSKPTPIQEEVPKKRQRKAKLEEKIDSESKEPFTVTLEDVARPKESNFFTFINVDPLLQPSYVLPTANIIQESQISTSSAVLSQPTQNKDSKEKDKYPCNMCGETFSREKKLLSHIQSHYAKMDEEDEIRVEKTTRKRGKKST